MEIGTAFITKQGFHLTAGAVVLTPEIFRRPQLDSWNFS